MAHGVDTFSVRYLVSVPETYDKAVFVSFLQRYRRYIPDRLLVAVRDEADNSISIRNFRF